MATKFPRIRRTVPGIGLVQIATKARTKRDHERRVVLFDELVEDAQIGVLQALLDGRITWEELLELKRAKKLVGSEILGNLALQRPLFAAGDAGERKSAVTETLPSMGKAKKTRERYATSFATLEQQAVVAWAHAPARVADLLTLDWTTLRDWWVRPVAEGGAGRSTSDWNNLARAVSAFLTKYLGRETHEFRLDVVKAIPRFEDEERVPDLTPERFRAILAEVPEHVRPVFVTLLLTGMRVRTEYLRADPDEHLLPATCQVKIPGANTKTKKTRHVAVAPDMWPWIVAAIPAPIGYVQLRRHWVRACLKVGAGRMVPTGRTKRVRVKRAVGDYLKKGEQHRYAEVPQLRYRGLWLHDLRHALGQWAEDAGVPLTDIQQQLGHAVLSMTARYSRRGATKRAAKAVGDALGLAPRAAGEG